MKTYSITEKDEIGKKIAEIMMLRKNRQGRYKTIWGDKTAIGIFNMITSFTEKINAGLEINL